MSTFVKSYEILATWLPRRSSLFIKDNPTTERWLGPAPSQLHVLLSVVPFCLVNRRLQIIFWGLGVIIVEDDIEDSNRILGERVEG